MRSGLDENAIFYDLQKCTPSFMVHDQELCTFKTSLQNVFENFVATQKQNFVPIIRTYCV